MSKPLKIIGVVAGIAALLVLIPPLGAAVGITTVAGAAATSAILSAIAVAANFGSQALAKPPPARGSVSQIMVAVDAPRPYAMGEGYFGGVLRYDRGYGVKLKKVPNPYRFMVMVYSVGPIESISPRVDFGSTGGWYSGFLYTDTQLGACPESNALAPHWAGAPGWTAASKLSGLAAIGWSLLFDKDGERYAGGVPLFGAYGRWAKVYDPRLDSTQPGGSGSHRIGNESTYTWSENPALHAGTYAYGRYQNGKRVMGMGLPADGIEWAVVAAWANVCDANDWTMFGVVIEPDDRVTNLRDICIAGGGEPIFGATLSFKYSAPVVALDTITVDDLTDDDRSVMSMQSFRNRINTAIPKYRSPAHNWEIVDAEPVVNESFLAEDGEEKREAWPFNFVKNPTQAAQLAAYRIFDSRELAPITLVCKPRLRHYRPGECLHLDLLDDLGLDTPAIILNREIDPVTLKVTLTLMSETVDKHAYCLGQVGVAPPTPSLAQTSEQRDKHAAIVNNPKAPLPGQMLFEETFDEDWWHITAPADRISWADSRTGYGVYLPFVEDTDLRVYDTTPIGRMTRTQEGAAVWARIAAEPVGVTVTADEITFGGESVTFGGEEVSFGELFTGAPGDFALELAIDWLDLSGDFISRSVVALLDPADGKQIGVGRALAPADGYARLSVGYSSQSGASGGWVAFEPWKAEYQPTADNTANSAPALNATAAVPINVDYLGQALTPFPLTLVNTRQRGNVDVSAITEWTATFPTGMTASINNTPDDDERGFITITNWVGTGSGTINLTSTLDGVALSAAIPVQVSVGSAPSTGGSGGGGSSTGTTATTYSISSTNSTSYGSPNTEVLTVEAGDTGVVSTRLSASYEPTATTIGERAAVGKVQWRVPAGTWADIDTEVTSDVPSFRYYDPENRVFVREPGFLLIEMDKTGLTPGSPYEFRVLLRNDSGTVTLQYVGSFTVQGQ